jgi:ribosomal protein S18 acetylase RimI-like enzyme
MSSALLESIRIDRIDGRFERWEDLLSLILRSFEYMDDVIDPPSSAHRLTLSSLREKALQEVAFVASRGAKLLGCVFIAERASDFYLGKLAVAPEAQGFGIGRKLLETCERHAEISGKPVIELQTRIELVANQRTFQKFGFREVARTAHEDYARPTSITMRKSLR